ncbi:MAG: DUF1800 domain-containing protein [Abitibacteriaceae bacterium]|nr:DUF1800 domain-containing protein [Abditibacteriaceae bacterium]
MFKLRSPFHPAPLLGVLAVPGLLYTATSSRAAETTVSTKTARIGSATRPSTTKPTTLSGDQKILHTLNRLGFGPRPGDVETVRQMGLGRWIDQQLSPESIDDSKVEGKVSRLTTLNMPANQLMLAYTADTAAFIKNLVKEGKIPNGNDPINNMPATAGQVTKVDTMQLDLKPEQRRLLDMVENSGLPRGLSIQAVGELEVSKITRAVESNRQLQEVLVDFWSNHFNLDVKKGPVRTLKVVDEREVIRPHVLGTFRQLLGASAKSPAMLFYLDNARSTKEFTTPLPRRNLRAINQGFDKNKAARKSRGGINENYARELMELHTLGVDGGYTQKDVQEVARCFTGWSIDRQTGHFHFYPFLHDDGVKTVLGHTIPAGGGIQDGEMVLDLLAAHPSTAHFIGHKLCVRFVSDTPPAALVDRVAKTFLDTGGDLKQVVRAIAYSPEFFSTAAYRAKIKSPFEFAVSAVRALGGQVEVPDPTLQFGRVRLLVDGGASVGQGGGAKGLLRRFEKGRGRNSLAEEVATMGQPLFSYQAPTGYTENSQSWVSAGALIARLNFALALTGGEVSDANISLSNLMEGIPTDNHEAVLDRLSEQLLGGGLSPATRDTLMQQMAPGTPANAAKIAALILGSPEFQRR